jgi:hypothetical protein
LGEYRAARDRIRENGHGRATDAKIAEELLIGPRQLSRLVQRFGRPPE